MNYRGTLLWPLAAALIVIVTWVGKRLEGDDD